MAFLFGEAWRWSEPAGSANAVASAFRCMSFKEFLQQFLYASALRPSPIWCTPPHLGAIAMHHRWPAQHR
jgi:hypothetical protein